MRRMTTKTGTESLAVSKMMRFQSTLPKLPVPPLRQTCEKYLRYLKPIVSEKQFTEATKNVQDFLNSRESELLHEYVVGIAHKPETQNWLERWWSDSYLTDRSSPGVFMSPVIQLQPNPVAAVNGNQTLRAAILLHHTVTYKNLIDQEKLEPGTFKGKPFCMADYKYFLNAVRVPLLGKDMYATAPYSRHVIVMAKGRIFKVDVIQHDGVTPFSVEEIKSQLDQVAWMTSNSSSHHSTSVGSTGSGVLTALGRDDWAKTRAHIITHSARDHLMLRTIEEAVCVLTLDNANPTINTRDAIKLFLAGAKEESKMSPDEGSEPNCLNRWYDKSFQIHVCGNGAAACTFEHCAMDSLPALYWMRHVTTAEKKDGTTYVALAEQGMSTSKASAAVRVEEISFTPTEELVAAQLRGIQQVRKVAKELDAEGVNVFNMGADRLKELKVSPDAFVQMCFQIAFKQIRGYTPSTYESCATKTFLHGRTETLRSATMESNAMVSRYLEGRRTGSNDFDAEIAALFRKATVVHTNTAKDCLEGQGCDRHLFGMVCAARELGRPVPPALSDESFRVWSKILLSTSHPLAVHGGGGCTFGPVNDQCIGCGYFVYPDRIHVSITSWTQGEAAKFASALEETFQAMDKILATHQPPTKAKL